MQLPSLPADIACQIEHALSDPGRLDVGLHHRLVLIHPFSNGNGRHARLMADVLIEQLGGPRFSWGGSEALVDATSLPSTRMTALRQAERRPRGSRQLRQSPIDVAQLSRRSKQEGKSQGNPQHQISGSTH